MTDSDYHPNFQLRIAPPPLAREMTEVEARKAATLLYETMVMMRRVLAGLAWHGRPGKEQTFDLSRELRTVERAIEEMLAAPPGDSSGLDAAIAAVRAGNAELDRQLAEELES